MTTRATEIDRIDLGPEAAQLARAAYDALIELLEDLDPDDWQRQTVCEAWDGADMTRHILGAVQATASYREGARQFFYGMRHRDEHGGSYLDALNHKQIVDRQDLGTDELVSQLRRDAPRAVRGRMRIPAAMGDIPLPVPSQGSTPQGAPQRLTVGELNAVTYTRDTWLHRTDIARATDRPVELDPATDGRIVEDVVAEWAQRHGRAFELTLTGPAGGHYVAGAGGPEMTLDPVDFCWILSGRSESDPDRPGADLLGTPLLF